MMPSLNLFRQAVAEGETRSELSNIGVGLLVVFVAIAAGLWLLVGPRWFIALPLLAGAYCAFSLKVAAQWQKAAVLRLGRYRGLRGPGLFHIIPVIDSVSQFVDQRVRVTDVRAETALTRDTVPVNVDAIVFWVVWNPEKAILEVMNFGEAVKLSAQTALRESIGRHELSQMITDRETLGRELQRILDEKTNPWGITVQSVEIRDVQLPKELEDAMSRRAQAERERQARIILGTAETEISEKFAAASVVYPNNPVALHLRAMNMLYEAIKERGSMIIVPSSAVETMGLGGLMGTAALAERTRCDPPTKMEGPAT
jgi:regulator of protease activity HflC (stomatin/prohibitin superfamily)